jgi:hypothetical protein
MTRRRFLLGDAVDPVTARSEIGKAPASEMLYVDPERSFLGEQHPSFVRVPDHPNGMRCVLPSSCCDANTRGTRIIGRALKGAECTTRS